MHELGVGSLPSFFSVLFAGGFQFLNVKKPKPYKRKTIRAHFGKIDILVNCAGLALLDDAENISDEYWQKTMEVNLTGSLKMCPKVGHLMIEQGKGGEYNHLSFSGSTYCIG